MVKNMKKRKGGWFSHKSKKEVSQTMSELVSKRHANIKKNTEILLKIIETIKSENSDRLKVEAISNFIES